MRWLMIGAVLILCTSCESGTKTISTHEYRTKRLAIEERQTEALERIADSAEVIAYALGSQLNSLHSEAYNDTMEAQAWSYPKGQ